MRRRSSAKLAGDVLAVGLLIAIVIRIGMWLYELVMRLVAN